jgi:glutaredoxin
MVFVLSQPKPIPKPNPKTSMNSPKITAYLKPSCGWSQGVRAIMRKYDLSYEDRDVINNRSIYKEMVEKSGQRLSPCVEIDGHMLADVSGDEVEAYLLKAGLVQPTVVVADAPTDRACDAHHHE